MLLFADSFDHYAIGDILEKWTSLETNGGTPTLPSAGRHGSKGYQAQTGGLNDNRAGSRVRKVLATSGDTFICGMGFRSVTAFNLTMELFTGDNSLVQIIQGGALQGFLRLNSNGTLSYFRGDGTQLGSATTASLTANTYASVELKVKIHNSAGTVDVKLNGTSVLSLTAQDTQNTASATWDEFALGSHRVPGTNSVTWQWDDLYVSDGSGAAPLNDFLGDIRVDAGLPTAAGATAGWTPGGTGTVGANYANVNENPPNDDSNYNEAASTGLTDTFVMPDAPVGSLIYGVQFNLTAKKTDAGLCGISPVARVSGTDYVGVALSPGTAYSNLLAIQTLNPATSAPWTETEFNGAEFGYKRSA